MARKVEDAFFICMKQFAKIKLQFADFATWDWRDNKKCGKNGITLRFDRYNTYAHGILFQN